MATVKGDVHDIGKNIVGVVLACNNYEVIDLGVMVPCEKILQTAREQNCDIIGLSGLITPSLDEMVHVAKEMQRADFSMPLLIGGATTSKAHTALKIQQHYRHGVIHVLDASRSVNVVSSLLNPERKPEYLAGVNAEYQKLRTEHAERSGARELLTFDKAGGMRFLAIGRRLTFLFQSALARRNSTNSPSRELVDYFDWSPFFHAWELRGRFPAIFDDPVVGVEARKLYDDARRLLDDIVRNRRFRARGVLGFWTANRIGEDIQLYADPEATVPLAMFHGLRQQMKKPRRPAKLLAGGLRGSTRMQTN